MDERTVAFRRAVAYSGRARSPVARRSASLTSAMHATPRRRLRADIPWRSRPYRPSCVKGYEQGDVRNRRRRIAKERPEQHGDDCSEHAGGPTACRVARTVGVRGQQAYGAASRLAARDGMIPGRTARRTVAFRSGAAAAIDRAARKDAEARRPLSVEPPDRRAPRRIGRAARAVRPVRPSRIEWRTVRPPSPSGTVETARPHAAHRRDARSEPSRRIRPRHARRPPTTRSPGTPLEWRPFDSRSGSSPRGD